MSTSQVRLKIAGGAGLLTLIAACSASAPPAAKASDDNSAPHSDTSLRSCARERARAAELAKAAETVTPPEIPPLHAKADSLAFVSGPVVQWVKARRAAVDKADEAHAAALACTPNDERGRLLLERGRLQSHLVTTFLQLGEAAMPQSLVADPEMKRAVLGSLTDTVKPQLDRARSSFQQCVALGNEAAPADVSACSSELAQLPGAAGSAAASAARHPEPSKHLAYPRPFVATSQPRPCVFAGTLRLWRPLLAMGAREVARVEQVELSAVTLPSARSGPFIIETAWPIRGTFTLAASSLPFNLRSRVDLVPQHVWLSRGAAVSAAVAPGGALAYRPVLAGSDTKPDPAVKVACSALELAGSVEPKDDDVKGERMSFTGSLALSGALSGPTVGTLTLSEPKTFVLLGQKNGWLHIQSLTTPFRGFHQPLPFDFDAWTQSTPTDKPSSGMIGLFSPTTPPTHASTAELTLYAEPSRTQPIGKLVKNVPLLVGESRDSFVNIVVPGLDAAQLDQSGFWAEKAAVKVSVQAL